MYKALVVDDEYLIREGISRVIREHCPRFEQVYEAKDGDEALALALDMSPDLILTDIQMPSMNGIELIEQIKAENPDVAVVIVSGYDDFDYARRGLKLAVQDYLLKPIDNASLAARVNDIAEALDRQHTFRRDQAELRRIVEESLPLYRERLYRDLIEGGGGGEANLRERARRLDVPLHRRFYAGSAVRFDGAGAREENELYVEAMAMEIVQGTAGRSAGELTAFGFFAKDREIALVIGSDEPTKERAFAAMNQFLIRLSIAFEKNLNLSDAAVALGAVTERIGEIADSYRQAQEAMRFRLSATRRVVLNIEEWGSVSIPVDNVKNHSEQLLLHVKLLQEEQALREVRAFMSTVASEGAHPHWAKLLILELSMSLLRGMEEAQVGIDGILRNKELDPYENVYRRDTAAELLRWLEELVVYCTKEMERSKMHKGASHVEKAKQVIESRVGDSRLSLNDVAATLFLSPNYLRQLFRQETGESFVEYVTTVRMEKAAECLKDPTLKIQDVAEKTGFMEQRYFSSCFKKHYGMTPTEYREALQEGLL